MPPRVVVSGIGVVTSIGEGRETFWSSLLAGRSGVGLVTSFDTSGYPVHDGAEIHSFDPEHYVRRLPAARMGRASQFAIAAARLALEDSGIDLDESDTSRFGVVVGTTSGEPHIIEALDDAWLSEERPKQIEASFVQNIPATCSPHTSPRSSGSVAGCDIPDSLRRRQQRARVRRRRDPVRFGRRRPRWRSGRVLAHHLYRILAARRDRARAMPAVRSRSQGNDPWRRRRDAPARIARARGARGARIYAELVGYGLSCDAHHMTAGHPLATARSARCRWRSPPPTCAGATSRTSARMARERSSTTVSRRWPSSGCSAARRTRSRSARSNRCSATAWERRRPSRPRCALWR